MFSLNRKTNKRYYEDFNLDRCAATVVKLGAGFVELDATVAYPEGGGQDADHGVIALKGGVEVRFIHARKMYGDHLAIADCPEIQVGGVIEHIVHPDDIGHLANVRVGDAVEVRIDRLRRAQLSLSHTACHLLLIGAQQIRPDAAARILGCHIRTDAARLDFAVEERISTAEIREIEAIANAFVLRASDVRVYPYSVHPDARYWECEGNVIPCGGTHLDNARPIGPMEIRRKSMGAGKERLSCSFSEAVFAPDAFHS
ncbi:alanyl-tRNA editing protein [Paraburkholderia aromaticivorans]|uniref:Synthetase n=1 Tax=Paraburkholderia aromaticivorans TaxID=2026199 RepID=A0A248VLH5_9BURK|nr:alanyl-tRNA editing protein [Paraburkholderia aromaticivorans]ASV99722.1 synthetase [Paraburkholderia aromaticivorans]